MPHKAIVEFEPTSMESELRFDASSREVSRFDSRTEKIVSISGKADSVGTTMSEEEIVNGSERTKLVDSGAEKVVALCQFDPPAFIDELTFVVEVEVGLNTTGVTCELEVFVIIVLTGLIPASLG